MTIPPDLLRLLAVPAFAWLAWRDHRTRRIPQRAWYPLVLLGLVAIGWQAALVVDRPTTARVFGLRVAISLGLLVPLAVVFHRLGGFGAADAKAFGVLALLYPTFPVYALGGATLPIVRPPLGVFSLTIVTDAVLIGVFYPVGLIVRNAAVRRFSPVMAVGRPVGWESILTTHGKLLETPDGVTFSGLDLDALRMYLRWRGLPLANLREDPDGYRSPGTLPEQPVPIGDGAVDPDADPRTPPTRASTDAAAPESADPWGARAFVDEVGAVYGTTPESLRAGLDVLVEVDTVWISPGVPFLIPLFVGLLSAYVVGDLLYAILVLVGAL